MFFDEISEIEEIALKNSTAVFVVPRREKVEIKNAIRLMPEEKTVVTIEQVREVEKKINMRQIEETIVLIYPAEKLGEEAANALLKNLEEPKEKVHFVLITETLSSILPTILSRAAIYFLREKGEFFREVYAEDKIKEVAKRLIMAKGRELVDIAKEMGKERKEGARKYALEVTRVAIEILYKAYFLMGEEGYLQRLPRFLKLFERIEGNGNIKLQVVACLC